LRLNFTQDGQNRKMTYLTSKLLISSIRITQVLYFTERFQL